MRGAAGEPGDLVQTAAIIAAERQRTPNLAAILILTTNRESSEALVRDAEAAAANRQ